jgi:hypothetical protein
VFDDAMPGGFAKASTGFRQRGGNRIRSLAGCACCHLRAVENDWIRFRSAASVGVWASPHFPRLDF